MTRIGIIFLFWLYSIAAFCQGDQLSSLFKKHQVFDTDAMELYKSVFSQRGTTIKLQFDRWDIQVHEVELFGANYRSLDYRGNIVRNSRGRAIPLSGHTRTGGKVSITIGPDFIYGFIIEESNTYFIEPLRYFEENARSNAFVVYNSNDVINDEPKTCGYNELHHHKRTMQKTHQNRSVGLCYDVEYGICNDYSMYTKYGSIPQAEAHAIGVTNNVNTDYDDTFADEVRFVISGQYTVDCMGCDPWSSTTNSSTLLSSFRTWAISNLNSAPLNISHDVASLWTDRDLNGTTIGVAYNPGVCISNLKYNILQDFSSSAAFKRVLVSHEIGHNFDMDHDVSGTTFVMSPSVTNTTTWSASSIASGDAYISNISCLSICAGTVPQANFQEFTSSAGESGIDGTGGLCNEPYVLKDVAVTLSNAPTSDVKISVTPNASSTTTSLSDFEMVTDTVIFTNGGSLVQYAQIRIYDDKIEELDETLILDLNVESGTANLGPFNQQTMTVGSSGDEVSAACCSNGPEITYGTFSIQAPGIFLGDTEDARTRIILKASEISAAGLVAGVLDRLSLYVFIKNSTGTFNNFRIGMLGVSESELAFSTPWYSTEEVHISDVTTAVGWMDFDFQSDFIWDGTSNIYVEFCFDNSSSIGDDNIVMFNTATANTVSIHFFEVAGTNACDFNPSNTSYYSNLHPHIRLRRKQGAVFSTDINASSSARLAVGETGHFYDNSNEVIVSIKNVGDVSMECVDVSIDESGNGNSNLPFGTYKYSDKQLYIDADHDALYELTVYFRDSELAVWAPNQGDLNIAHSSMPFSSTNEVSTSYVNTLESESNVGAGNARSYKATVFGDGYFALTDGEHLPLLTEITMSDVIIDQSGNGIVLFSPNGDKYLLALDNNGDLSATLNNSVTFKASLEGGDLIFDSNNYSMILNNGSEYKELVVDNEGILTTGSVGILPDVNITLQSGNISVSGNGRGFILRNAADECWKVSVSNLGNIIVQQMACS